MRPDTRTALPPLAPIAAAIATLLFTVAVQAQSSPPAVTAPTADSTEAITIPRVEVTARRRLETQFDVPASVTAVSGSELRAAGITDIQGMVALIPNANMTENPQGDGTYISIRGMRQADSSAAPNFGLYRNGIFAGGRRINLGSQVDVSRFEVVRGPQGGLYGREAVGGAANIIYAMPTPGDKLNGYTTLAVESDQRTRLESALTMPVNDSLAVRATAWLIDQKKGEFYNITLGEEIDRNSDKGLRVSAAANLSSSLSLLGTLEYQRVTGPSLRTYAADGIANGPVAKSPTETPRTVRQDTSSRNDIEQLYASGKLTYSADAGTLTLMASARDYALDATRDQDQTALPLNAGPLALKQALTRNEKVKQYYVEALWESDVSKPLTWRAGASYFNEDFRVGSAFLTSLDTALLGFIGIPNVGVINGAAGIPNPGSSTTVNSFSAFGDLRYELNRQLAVTATLRYTRDQVDLNWSQGIDPSSHPVAPALFAGVVPNFALTADDTFSFTSPSLGVEYKLNRDTNVYAAYSTGYRPGGYNTSVTNPAYLPYGQESARNIEAGVKTRFLDGRAGLNLTVFRMEQKDLTVQQDDLSDTQFGFAYLANVGAARTTGLELEAMARLTRAVGASFSVGYLDAKYTRGIVNAGTPSAIDVTGRELQGVRPWTLNARMDFRQAVSGSTEFFAAVAVRREIGGVIGNVSDIPLEAITKVDLNAGLDFSKRTQLSAFVRNAGDEKVILFRYGNGAASTNLGRRYGLQLTHQY